MTLNEARSLSAHDSPPAQREEAIRVLLLNSALASIKGDVALSQQLAEEAAGRHKAHRFMLGVEAKHNRGGLK